MLTPREKSPLPENVPRGGSNPRRCGQRAQALPTELFRPPSHNIDCKVPNDWQGSHWNIYMYTASMTRPGSKSGYPALDHRGSQGLCLLVGCLTSQQQASVSLGQICPDKSMCCHTEIKVEHQTFYLTQSKRADTGPTSPSSDPVTPGARGCAMRANQDEAKKCDTQNQYKTEQSRTILPQT